MKAKTQKIEQRYNNVNCAGMVYGTAKPILYPPRSTLRHYIYLRMVPNEKINVLSEVIEELSRNYPDIKLYRKAVNLVNKSGI